MEAALGILHESVGEFQVNLRTPSLPRAAPAPPPIPSAGRKGYHGASRSPMPPPPPKTVASTLRHLVLPLSILAVGLVCTLGFYVWGRHVQALDDQARIRQYSERVEAALRDHLGRDEDLLLGAQGYLAQRGAVTPAAWADYIRRLDLARRHPGLSSMAFIVPVPDADLASFLAHGLPPGSHYHLPRADPQPLGDPGAEGRHLILTRCEPAAQSPNAIGLDVGASRTQREAADRALATGRAALSGLLYFNKDQGQQEAVALFLPVFRAGKAGRHLLGWVSAGILIRPLVRDILRDEDRGLTFELLDDSSTLVTPWLYASPRWPVNAQPVAIHHVRFAGRSWEVRYAELPAFRHTAALPPTGWLLATGLVGTLSLAAGAAGLAGTRARALDLAGRMTGSLHQALARNRGHLENTPLAVIETDADFHIQEWNPAAERIFGYTQAEMLGQDPRLLVPDPQQASLSRRRKAFVAGRGGSLRLTLESLTKTGDLRLCDWTITGIQDDEGGFAGAMFMADDITERRKGEEALRQAQKLESLGVLAGGIAHDFNNLLTAVLGNTEIALLQAPEGSLLRAALERIDTAARRGADLARQLLAYAGKGRMAVRPLDLNRAIQEMSDLLAVSISKKVALACDLQPDLPAVEADGAQVQQVVMNLVINASEAIGDQPGTITLRTRSAQLGPAELSASFPGQALEPGPFVRLEVEDDGCGMDAETIGRIFDPFFSTKFTGRGLGLSAMLGIVKGHKAGLRVDSRPGQGTTFTLLFPACDRPVHAEAERTDSTPGLKGRVLVADDEGSLRDLARSALESAGLEVLEARDGQEALERFEAEEGRIHLVFLDMTMPRMGGAEAFRRLRRMDPAVRVLLTSGYTEQEALDALDGLVPDGFLQKPFRIRDLVAKAREVLAAAPSRDIS